MWSGVLGLTVTRSAHNSGKPLIADPIDVPGTAYGGRPVPGDCQGDAISKLCGSKRGASAGGVLCLVVWSQRLAKKVTLLSEGQALQPGQQAPAARQQAPQAMNQRGRAPARWRSYRAPESWLRGSFHGSARQCGA